MAGHWLLILIVLGVAVVFALAALRERARLHRSKVERAYRMKYEPRGYKAHYSYTPPRGADAPSQRDTPSHTDPGDESTQASTMPNDTTSQHNPPQA